MAPPRDPGRGLCSRDKKPSPASWHIYVLCLRPPARAQKRIPRPSLRGSMMVNGETTDGPFWKAGRVTRGAGRHRSAQPGAWGFLSTPESGEAFGKGGPEGHLSLGLPELAS